MIRFFRRIRKKLIEEGHLKKYLLYAVGEILLIVIGIFIALQLNNWNAELKDRALEQAYYCKLLEDLNQDSIHINTLIAETEARLKSANTMLHLLQMEKPVRAEVAQAMLGAVSKTTFTFKPSVAAFDDLKSSGNLKLLRDIALKDSLINYYSVLEGYIDVIDVNADATVAEYYDQDNFIESGWQHMPFIKKEIDSTLVNVQRLDLVPYPTDAHRSEMMSKALLFIGTNARTKHFYGVVKENIYQMRRLLGKKCIAPY